MAEVVCSGAGIERGRRPGPAHAARRQVDGAGGRARRPWRAIACLEPIRQYALERLEASDEAATYRARHATALLELAETRCGPTWPGRRDLRAGPPRRSSTTTCAPRCVGPSAPTQPGCAARVGGAVSLLGTARATFRKAAPGSNRPWPPLATRRRATAGGHSTRWRRCTGAGMTPSAPGRSPSRASQSIAKPATRAGRGPGTHQPGHDRLLRERSAPGGGSAGRERAVRAPGRPRDPAEPGAVLPGPHPALGRGTPEPARGRGARGEPRARPRPRTHATRDRPRPDDPGRSASGNRAMPSERCRSGSRLWRCAGNSATGAASPAVWSGWPGVWRRATNSARPAWLFGAAEAQHHGLGIRLRHDEEIDHTHLVALTRQQLGDAFARAWRDGQAATVDEAIVRAFEGTRRLTLAVAT